MDFKAKFFNSEHLNEIETRRLKIQLNNLKFYEFLSYLKGVYDIGDAETIYVFWKDDSIWSDLKTDDNWDLFIKKVGNESSSVIKINIYYGNVHIRVNCDICGYIVVGDRYKCLQCDDYDICQICMQTKPNCHKEHCMIILRTAKDATKFLCSIPNPLQNGVSDFRVIDTDMANLIANVNLSTKIDEKTMENSLPKENEPRVSEKADGPCCSNNVIGSVVKEETVDTSMTGEESSIPQDYLDKLPPHIFDGLNKLRSMGFKNINSPLIALLIEKNGNIPDVIAELEYSLKKK